MTCLRINPSREFRSKVRRRNFVSRIEATCLTPNLIYLITCKVCGKQGVGSTEYLPARISNYYSHIKKKKRTNKFSLHFQEKQNHTAEDMDIQIIDKLLSIPKDPKELTLKLKRVEGFWQAHLRTVAGNGLNSVDELSRNLFHKKDDNLGKCLTLLDRNHERWIASHKFRTDKLLHRTVDPKVELYSNAISGQPYNELYFMATDTDQLSCNLIG